MKQAAFASVAVESSRREEICAIFDEPYDPDHWNDWRWQMRHRLTRLDQFERLLDLTEAERRGLLLASEKFSVAVTPHFAALIDPDDPSCPIRLQVVPQESELVVSRGDMTDPCGEDGASVVEGLVHRYPDRVLFLALDTCAAYCRYCTRSRLVSQGELDPIGRRLEAAIAYLRGAHRGARRPALGRRSLLMADCRARQAARPAARHSAPRVPAHRHPHPELPAAADHAGAGAPCCASTASGSPLHFCHARELTPEVAEACDLLADGGIPLGCQTVLLKGVNDSAETLRDLFHGLLKIRVRPYYLYQCDPVLGTGHLRTSVEKGLEIMSQLRGFTTGYAVPTYVIDAPGGGGKVPVQNGDDRRPPGRGLEHPQLGGEDLHLRRPRPSTRYR